jgi:hypothetical protein
MTSHGFFEYVGSASNSIFFIFYRSKTGYHDPVRLAYQPLAKRTDRTTVGTTPVNELDSVKKMKKLQND